MLKVKTKIFDPKIEGKKIMFFMHEFNTLKEVREYKKNLIESINDNNVDVDFKVYIKS